MSFLRKFVLIGETAFCLLAAGQTPAKPPESANPTSGVAATQPVITVRGLCAHDHLKTNDATGCIRPLNREQFEGLVHALNPEGLPLPANGLQHLARTYAEYLAVEAAAKNSGLEDTIQFRELMEWLRLKTITDLYGRKLQEKYGTPTQEEITTYYKQHFSDYETAKLVRVLIPRDGPLGQDKNEFDKKAHQPTDLARPP